MKKYLILMAILLFFIVTSIVMILFYDMPEERGKFLMNTKNYYQAIINKIVASYPELHQINKNSKTRGHTLLNFTMSALIA